MITSTKERGSSLSELKSIPLIVPEWASSRWQGIQHGELVETIHTQLDHHNINVIDEGWYVSGPDVQRLNGSMSLEIPGVKSMEGTSFSLGVQHSNLGDHALKFAVGAKIFICSNGVVIGDYAVKRRHTIGLNLMESIGIGIETYINKVKDVPIVVQKMRDTEMRDDDVDHALMAAGREGLVSWSRIGQVDKEYRKPTFADHDEKTAWGLYNAFTYTIQKMPPQYHIKSMNRFREILVNGVAA